MHKKLLEGGLISTEARYRDITYGYRFLNDDVGRLFEKAKSIFSGNFGGIAYEFEYYCTTMGILYGLIQKENIHLGEELSLEHQRFCLSQKELMDSIYVFSPP